jgi:hypothetical protein
VGWTDVWNGFFGRILGVSLRQKGFSSRGTDDNLSFSGNINLLNIFPFLGKTQLQVLSFLTSVILMATHGLTAYSVKERVLFRDK